MNAANDWERVSVSGAKIVLRGLRDTLRLANGPAEIVSVLRAFVKAALWRPNGSLDDQRDQIMRLHGVTHVVGLRTGELFVPVEIYQSQVYDQVPDFLTQPGWIVVDVGANTGVYAVKEALRGAQVYAFEPNPDCYRRLRKAVKANELEDRVITSNRALGASTGMAELCVPQGLTTMGSLRPEWAQRDGGTSVMVETDTLDSVVRRFGIERVDLLKVDVEGLELDVLEGASESLALVERVVVEYHSLELGRRLSELVTERGFVPVLDEPLYRGDEKQYKGVGRGLLFARRPLGNSRLRPSV